MIFLYRKNQFNSDYTIKNDPNLVFRVVAAFLQET